MGSDRFAYRSDLYNAVEQIFAEQIARYYDPEEIVRRRYAEWFESLMRADPRYPDPD